MVGHRYKVHLQIIRIEIHTQEIQMHQHTIGFHVLLLRIKIFQTATSEDRELIHQLILTLHLLEPITEQIITQHRLDHIHHQIVMTAIPLLDHRWTQIRLIQEEVQEAKDHLAAAVEEVDVNLFDY